MKVFSFFCIVCSANALKLSSLEEMRKYVATEQVDGISRHSQGNVRAGAKPFNRIYLLGERNSGTSFVEKDLLTKFSNYGGKNKVFPLAKDIPVLEFKHMFRHTLLNATELATMKKEASNGFWAFVVRSPCSWADGMWRMAWHMCLDEKNCTGPRGTLHHGLSKVDFLKHKWLDWPEYNLTAVPAYRDIFELRYHKMKIMEQIEDIFPDQFAILNAELFKRNPNATLESLEKTMAHGVADKLVSLVEGIEDEYCLSQEEWAVIQGRIDWEQERKFGYDRRHCCIETDGIKHNKTRTTYKYR